MTNVGIICDFEYSRHHLFKSYFYSVKNLYGEPKRVKGINDLQGLNLLFIGDDHYGPHKEVWQGKGFIEECNKKDIHVIVLTNERIMDSFFPWNKENFIQLRKFNHLTQYVNDVDDCMKLGLKLNRQAMSRSFISITKIPKKKDRMVFIGRTECKSYRERVNVLKTIEKIIPVDIISADIPTWEEYMNKIAEYRYVFSPIGNGNFFPMRFYETLAVGSIPVHQVRNNTLQYYDIESHFGDCIYFENPLEIKEKINKFTTLRSYNVLWMEDNLELRLKEDNLL